MQQHLCIHSCHPWALGLTLALGLLTFGGSTQAQIERVGAPDAAARRVAPSVPTVFSGRVVGPDGAAVAGAVVVTSAGGQAVSAADGSFLLAVE